MNEETTNIENIEENKKEKKKSTQKAALGIRPSNKIEKEFKEIASTKGISQTKLFEQIFRAYTHRASEEYRSENLDCSLELQNLKNSTTVLLKSIEEIVTKSQYKIKAKNREVKAMQEATDKKIELATLELNNRIAELEARNKELEKKLEDSNAIVTGFNTVKEDLDYKNDVLRNLLDSKDEEISCLKEQIKERDKAIKSLEKEIDNTAKEVTNIEKEVALIKEERNNVEAKLVSVQANNQMLQDTLNNFNIMKISEIEAIKHNEATMSELKISALEVSKNLEIDKLNTIISSLESIIINKDLEINNLTSTINALDSSKTTEIENLKEMAITLTNTIQIKESENKELKKALALKEKKVTKGKEKTKKEE